MSKRTVTASHEYGPDTYIMVAQRFTRCETYLRIKDGIGTVGLSLAFMDPVRGVVRALPFPLIERPVPTVGDELELGIDADLVSKSDANMVVIDWDGSDEDGSIHVLTKATDHVGCERFGLYRYVPGETVERVAIYDNLERAQKFLKDPLAATV